MNIPAGGPGQVRYYSGNQKSTLTPSCRAARHHRQRFIVGVPVGAGLDIAAAQVIPVFTIGEVVDPAIEAHVFATCQYAVQSSMP